jgi:hypothetical protein
MHAITNSYRPLLQHTSLDLGVVNTIKSFFNPGLYLTINQCYKIRVPLSTYVQRWTIGIYQNLKRWSELGESQLGYCKRISLCLGLT